MISPNSDNDSRCVDEFHRKLTVEMIATPRDRILTCSKDEAVVDVMNRIPKSECYDYLPVTDGRGGEPDRIVGVFHARPFYGRSAARADMVGGDQLCGLSEDHLIGANTGILDFVKEGHKKPWRLVISEAGVTGLVTLLDIQRPAARVALFSLIAALESCMIDAIRNIFSEQRYWLSLLSDSRREKVCQEMRKSRDDDGHVDDLLFTQLCDKRDIILRRFEDFDFAYSKGQFKKHMKSIERLRDKLVHANDYAYTQTTARDVCTVVGDLLTIRQSLQRVVISHEPI